MHFTLCVSVAFFVLVEWCVYCCGLLCALSFLGICCDLVWSCCCFHVYISCEVVFFILLSCVRCCTLSLVCVLCVFVVFEGLAGMVMCLVLACVFAVVSSNVRFFLCCCYFVCVLCFFCVSCVHVCSWRVLDLLVLKAAYGQRVLQEPV